MGQWFVRILIVLGMLVLFFIVPGMSQTTEQPLMGSEAAPELPAGVVASTPLEATVADDADVSLNAGDDGIFRVLVVGDGLAGGMGAGMTRMVEGNAAMEVVNRFNESSGLARPEFYDWASAIPKIATTKPFDAAVIMLGANDRQIIRDGENRLIFRSPEWNAFYEAQLDGVLEVLKVQGLRVYWVGLPPMADPNFDNDMRFISELHRKHVVAKGGHYIDIRAFFLGPDGSYVDRGPDETGTDRKLRTRDGIGFFKVGNNRLGQLVVSAVMKLEDQVNPGVGAIAPAVAAVELAPAPVIVPVIGVVDDAAKIVSIQPLPQAGPMFGQQGLNGTEVAFEASTVVPLKAKVSIEKQKQIVATSVVQGRPAILAAQGTAAEKLFTTGDSGPAPAGRFDDFSYVAPVTP